MLLLLTQKSFIGHAAEFQGMMNTTKTIFDAEHVTYQV